MIIDVTVAEHDALLRAVQLAVRTYMDSARLFRTEPVNEDIALEYDRKADEARALVLRLAKL